MKLNRLVILLASAMAMAMVVVSMFGVAAAQAEENKGPLWIVGSPARGLLAGETRAITGKTESALILKNMVAGIECEKATGTGVMLGGSPGTAYAKIIFEKCNVVGASNCLVTSLKPLAGASPGEVIVDLFTDLAFAKGSRTSAVDLFAPENEENLFSEIEFLNKTGATTQLCGALLNKFRSRLVADGTEVNIKGENRDIGQIAEVGHEVGGAFVLSTPSLTASIMLLRFGNGGVLIREAELYNTSTAKYEVVKAELSSAGLGGITEEASFEVEIPTLEPFGWNY